MTNDSIIIAVDPGTSGGIAYRVPGQPVTAYPMSATEGDLVTLLRSLAIVPGAIIAVVEEVGGYVGHVQPGAAMFKFGRGFGFILGVLQAMGVRVELVRPQKWQKALSLGNVSDCADKVAWKNKLKAEAQRRYPHLKVTLSTADALLLMEYALRGSAVIPAAVYGDLAPCGQGSAALMLLAIIVTCCRACVPI